MAYKTDPLEPQATKQNIGTYFTLWVNQWGNAV